MEFKLTIGDAKSKKTYQKSISDDDAKKLVGKKIGDTFLGELIDLKGYELEITGGSDSTGVPMRKGIHGQARKSVLTTPGVGFRGREKNKKKIRIRRGGLRVKKTVRGEVIAEEVSQINCKVVKQGAKPLEELFKKAEKQEGSEATEAQE